MRAALLAVGLAAGRAVAQKAGSFADGGNTLVSAMMMFLGNEEMVYILDKAEGNAEQINGHSAWASAWNINTHKSTVMDIYTNAFCSSGMHLPNGSYVTFGGNGAITKGGDIGSVKNPGGASASFDALYQDRDGAKSIRVLNPCGASDNLLDPQCTWFDNPDVLSMQRRRWYAAAEPLADGSVAIIGGFVNGGYVNRNFPNTDPTFEGGAAEPTFEFYPSKGDPQMMDFMTKTSGLNSYAHTFLMPSGKMFVQANISTMMWDWQKNVETPLPDMPNNVARVYPASGATAMLPLTPANNYTPTVLFCGGSDMPADDYGDYSWPKINTWDYPASKDCQMITPEPQDGSAPTYTQVDDLPVGRTMGQFITLPTGQLLIINGAQNGTAGYAQQTGQTPSYSQMPYGMSLSAGPVGQPALFDPTKPQGSRWSSAGFDTSNIARLYHSSAILLPDASVLVAGSNPNVDVNLTTTYATEYRAEIFYPSYFSASNRPKPSGIPKTLSYGGSPFDITLPASSYSGSANDAADNTTVVLHRGGFTTHAMNMGQRLLQLNNTYTVNSDGSITLHVSQAPPNANLFTPGPALLFVNVHGIPSTGSMLIVGNGQFGDQPTSAAGALPASVRLDTATGSGSSNSQTTGSSSSHTGAIVGGVIGTLAVLGIVGALAGVLLARRRRAAAAAGAGHVEKESSQFAPLALNQGGSAWASQASLMGTGPATPYKDEAFTPTQSVGGFHPYGSPVHGQSGYQ